MRLLLVDDHAVVRQGLRQILAEELPAPVFAEAKNGPEALALFLESKWDLVILDISMPGRGGMETLKEMHRLRPEIPVLVLSLHSEDQYAERAFRTGAAGYITKENAAPEELVKAVNKVVEGGRYVSPALAERLASRLTSATGGTPHEALSDREFQVLRLLATGKTAKEIAAELSVSEKTVSTYRARMLEKLRLSTTAELIRYAVQAGIVD